MTLHLAVCSITIVALMTANGLTATTNVYASHSKHSGNHTSSSSSSGMPISSTPSNNSPSSSTSGSGSSGSKDNSGTGSASNSTPSSGSGSPTGNSGTSTDTKAAPTITTATTTKKALGNNPCLTSLPITSCSSTETSGSTSNQSQTNHKERHHTGGDLGSSTNTKNYKHYDAGAGRHQNSTVGTPSGTGTDNNRTYDGPHGPKTGGKGAGEPNGTGSCIDSHFGSYGKSCGEGTHCIFIQEHGLFCRHGYVGGESHSKHEGDTNVMQETEIKVIREPSSVPYSGPSSVVLLSPTSNDFMNNNPATISVDHVTITTNGEQGWIKGTVTNNSNQTMHGLRITGTWYDSGNNTIGMSSGYVDGLTLNPGQFGTFSQSANYDKSTTPRTVELSYDWQ
jgi:hypothetical protein